MESKYPYKALYKYIPSRYEDLEPWQQKNQRIVLDFKEGKVRDIDLKSIATKIRKLAWRPDDNWVIGFVPAHTNEDTVKRFSLLAGYLKDNLSIPVCLDSIHNYEDYDPVHTKGENTFKLHSFIRSHFEGKNVILIDDIITSGKSFRTIGDKLMYIGAISIHGVIFAMTIHPDKPVKEGYNRTLKQRKMNIT